MGGLNREIIINNIQEAKDELEKLAVEIENDKEYDEAELAIALAHAYHHLNFAWNTRYISTEKYRKLTDKDFLEWSTFPKEIEDFGALGKK